MGFYGKGVTYSDAGVVVLGVELADVLLGVGGGHVDGDVDTAVHRFRFLSDVDSVSSEVLVQHRKVFFPAKPLVFNGLSLLGLLQILVDH